MNSDEKLLLDITASLGSPNISPAPDVTKFVRDYNERFDRSCLYTTNSVARRDGNKIHARMFGEKSASDDSSIVLMHGFPDNTHAYDLVVPHLMEKYQVIAFDFLGWGRSDKPAGHVFDGASMLEDLETVIDHFKLDRVTLVVHDLSGFPGIDWALKNPHRVDTLVLLNTVYFPSKALVSPDYIQRFATPGLARDISVTAAMHSRDFWYEVYFDQLEQFFSSDEAKETYIKIFAHHSYDAREAFFSAANVLRGEVGARAEKAEAMRNYSGQVKIIFGEDDKVMNVGMAEEFHDVFPNSQMHLIAKANHFVQLDQPQQVAELIATG